MMRRKKKKKKKKKRKRKRTRLTQPPLDRSSPPRRPNEVGNKEVNEKCFSNQENKAEVENEM